MKDKYIQGKFARAGYTGLTATRIGTKTVRFMATKPFTFPLKRKKAKDTLDEENAVILFKAFSQLRGTALKVAQILSMETEMLPEAYRRELAKSHHQVPPLNRAVVRKMITNELGEPPEKIFAEFNTKAFAAASLGQVHEATSHEGLELAVKIQYPGIAATIDSDIRLVSHLVRAMPKSNIFRDALEEIRLRLLEETDYTLEAENIQWFRDNLKIEGVQIPKVYRALSSKAVLSMQRLPGYHLAEWLKTEPSADQCNHFGELIATTFRHSLYDLKTLHADPNPGNYLFNQDGTLGLIDFGCVKHFQDPFVRQFSKLLSSTLNGNRDDIIEIYHSLGLVQDIKSPVTLSLYDEALKPFGNWIAKSIKPKRFNFAENRGYADEGIAIMKKFMNHPGFLNTNTDFVFLDRTIFGLYKIYEQLGATLAFKWPGRKNSE